MFEALWLEISQYGQAVQAFFAFDTARLADPEMIGRLALQFFLLLGSAFFSGSETALFSLSRLDLQKLRKDRNRHSETLHELLDQPRRLIISILSGNELVNIAAAANMTGILVTLYGEDRAGWINLLVMVPLLLLFGEVTPKTIAVSNPLRVSTAIVAYPMSGWVRIVAPLRWVIRSVADRVTTLIVGEERQAENILQVDEFRSLVEEVAKGGELNATERALIYNLLEAGDTEIVEIMTPRTRTAFLNADNPLPELIETFKAIRHPRVPLFRVHRDNLVGFLHAEDVLRLVLSDEDFSQLTVDDIMRPPVVAPPTKKVDEMFDFFQKKNARAAAVLNEFGGVEGFITLRDVLNFIFGQTSGIVTGQELYRERDENLYDVPGDMKLTDFNNLTNFGIEDPRMTTIGGVAFRHLDRLPRQGDTVTVEGIQITILEMQEHRISKVRVARGQAAEERVAEPQPVEQADTETAPPEPGQTEAAGATGEAAATTAQTESLYVAEEGVTASDALSEQDSDDRLDDADAQKTAIK
jgi:CBS domain containing-hemolysin-like protein